MTPRRRLISIQLVGARAVLRRVGFGLIVGAAAMCAWGYTLPAHRVGDDQAFHSNYDDGGPGALIACALVVGAWLLTRRRGYGAGYVLGVLAMAGALGAVEPVFLEHMFSLVETGYGELVYTLGVIGMFVIGFALAVLEPILYVGQRRQLERDVDPQFPTARVV